MLQHQHRRQPSKHASQRIVSDSITATQNDTESVQGFVELTEETKWGLGKVDSLVNEQLEPTSHLTSSYQDAEHLDLLK